ncbi:GldG family protein [Candidatus Peregrinibacteria bacterium]|nr:GldG family protein [Candidatus Peregrinibacteria bacterium]
MNFLHRMKQLRNSYIFTLLLLGIAGMIAYLSSQHFLRLDLTENQQYTLSSSSREVMESLDDIVTVKVFFSQELPPNLFAVRQYVEDILSELESFSKGNLNVHFLNPADDAVAEEAKALGIFPVRMNILAKDKFEVKNGFLGIALIYGDRHEVLPVVQNASNLEYDLVSALQKLTRPADRAIGFTVGHGEYPALSALNALSGERYKAVGAALGKNYRVEEARLSEKSLQAVDTLIVGGPRLPFSENEKQALESFLMSGRNIILLLDGADVDYALQASPLDVHLDDLLRHYGASVSDRFVLDSSNETASFSQGYFNFVQPYPFWVKAMAAHFNLKSPILSKLDSLVFPWASPVSLNLPAGVTAENLVFTTDEAWTEGQPFYLDPNTRLENSEPKERGQFVLAALLSGKFTRFYNVTQKKKNDPMAAAGRILIIGNSRFLTDRFVSQYPQNLTFFLNAVDYLTLDESLIGIRSKGVFSRPLRQMSYGQTQIVKAVGIFLMPALAVLYGIARSFRRRRQKYSL